VTSVSVVGGKIVVEGAETCPLCGGKWVAWDKGVREAEHLPGRPRSRPVLQAYTRLRCAEGHRLDVDAS
jgi:hypothetical protein